jgi:nucleotide-binding universal stress UspA family protein
MSFASVLAILSGGSDDADALKAAARLTREVGGEVRAILAIPTLEDLERDSGGYMTQDAVDYVQDGNAEVRRGVESVIREVVEQSGLIAAGGRMTLLPEQPGLEFEVLGETPLCDVLVVGRSTFQGLGVWSGVVSAALLAARLPFMIVGQVLEPAGVVAIAWDGGQAAGRAVRAALPLLTVASKVVILQDPEHLSAAQGRSAAPERLVDYLRLHGVRDIKTIRRPGVSRGDGLSILAKDCGATLLVAGAFSHTRLLEAMFRGHTEAMLQGPGPFNLLLTH